MIRPLLVIVLYLAWSSSADEDANFPPGPLQHREDSHDIGDWGSMAAGSGVGLEWARGWRIFQAEARKRAQHSDVLGSPQNSSASAEPPKIVIVEGEDVRSYLQSPLSRGPDNATL